MKITHKGFVSFLLAILSNHVFAAPNCSVTLHSDDQIRWDKSTIEVSKACETFTITLIHEGKLNKEVMGHNWLLTKAEDKEAVIRSLNAKELSVIKDDARIIAYSELIGGGEQTSVTFAVDQLAEGQTYSYFCGYPEHSELMQGTLVLVN